MEKMYSHIILVAENSTCCLTLAREINKNRCEYASYMIKNEVECLAAKQKLTLPYVAARVAQLLFSPTEREQGFKATLTSTEPEGNGYLVSVKIPSSENISENSLISAGKCATLSSAAKSDYSGKLRATVTVELVAEASTNDIYNWIQECNNPDTLKYLIAVMRNALNRLENPPDPRDDDVLR